MTTADPKCPSCKEAMQKGYVLGFLNSRQSMGGPSHWVEGEPVKTFWKGWVYSGTPRPLVAYRCRRCGLVLNYA